jgi:arylsulfatase A-like enzyme
LPAPRPGAKNVILIVWDTVRASSLTLHDYPRDTTPNLVHWARTGARYSLALAPAPWTFPSHSCFFTGRRPYQLDSHRSDSLDSADRTLAEYLAAWGYQTAGFIANTNYCSYETKLDRGFAHYDDYPLTPWFLLGRTVPSVHVASPPANNAARSTISPRAIRMVSNRDGARPGWNMGRALLAMPSAERVLRWRDGRSGRRCLKNSMDRNVWQKSGRREMCDM